MDDPRQKGFARACGPLENHGLKTGGGLIDLGFQLGGNFALPPNGLLLRYRLKVVSQALNALFFLGNAGAKGIEILHQQGIQQMLKLGMALHDLVKHPLGHKPNLASAEGHSLGLVNAVVGASHQRHIAKQISGTALANQQWPQGRGAIDGHRPPLQQV